MSFAKNSQDWGGRRKVNPDNVPKISRKDVLSEAKKLGVEIRREGLGMWLVYIEEKHNWYTLGQTNHLALENLQRFDRFKGIIMR